MKLFFTFFLLLFPFFQTQAQPYLTKDSLKVKVRRVIDGDTYEVVYRKKHVFSVRVRMPNPKDTLDTFDTNLKQARKQALQHGISVDSVQTLAAEATRFVEALLGDKTVLLRRYEDQTTIVKQFSFNRVLRGVEFEGKNIADHIPVKYRAK
jgi:endonuclease YncB( thermonuclease family)